MLSFPIMSPKTRLTSHERALVLTVSSVHALVHMAMLALPCLLLPIKEEFGTSLVGVAWAANAAGLAFGLFALPAGFLADRLSPRWALSLCLVGMGMSSLFTGLSTNIYTFIVAVFLLGAFGGLYHPAGLSLISQGVSSRRAKAISYHGIAGSIGLACGPLLAGVIYSLYNWRLTYHIYLFAFLAALAFLFLVARKTSSGEPTKTPNPNSAENPEPKTSIRRFFLTRRMLIFYAASATTSFVFHGSLNFLPTFLAEQLGPRIEGINIVLTGNIFTALMLLLGVVGQYVGGLFHETVKQTKVLAIVNGAVTVMLLGMGLFLGWWVLPFTLLFGLIYFANQPLTNTLAADFSPNDIRGRTYGILFITNFGLGSFGSSVGGYIGSATSLSFIYLGMAGASVVGFLLCVLLYFHIKKCGN